MSESTLTHRPAAEIGASPGPADYFTGIVHLEALAASGVAADVRRVSFTPGARTAWHTHPAGQVLVITSGRGFVATREWSRPIASGDVVEIPAGVEHWHGAGPDTPMQHLAIQQDPATDWRDQVSDADYEAVHGA